MKTWKAILQENTYVDDEFTIDQNNSAYIVDGVISSYEDINIFLDYSVTKEILDGASKAGYELEVKNVGDKKVYILAKTFGSSAIIFEMCNKQNDILKAYVSIGNEENKYNEASKLVTQFPSIFANFDFSTQLEDLNVEVPANQLANSSPYLYVGYKGDFETYFKFMYLFTKSMITKLKSTSDVKPQDVIKSNFIDDMGIDINTVYSELISNFTGALDKIKNKFSIALNYNVEFDKLAQKYTISLNWKDGYVESDRSIVDKILKLNDILKSECDKLNAKCDITTARTAQALIRTITIKYV